MMYEWSTMADGERGDLGDFESPEAALKAAIARTADAHVASRGSRIDVRVIDEHGEVTTGTCRIPGAIGTSLARFPGWSYRA